MLKKIAKKLAKKASEHLDQKTRNASLTIGGMGALLMGRKLTGLSLLTKGLKEANAQWLSEHLTFDGGPIARWRTAAEGYRTTHLNATNRKLHLLGTPVVLTGGLGLVLWPAYTPPWFLSAGTFSAGWAINLTGDFVFERSQLNLGADPLSFIAGPASDLLRLREIFRSEETPSPTPQPA